jgi:predicted site-specific integrase-resolvase
LRLSHQTEYTKEIFSTLNRLKNYFSQLLNVHRVSDVRQIEINTAKPLVPFEAEIATEKVKIQGLDKK